MVFLFFLRRHQKNKPPSSSKATTPPAAGPAIQALDFDGFGSSVGEEIGGLLVEVATTDVRDGSEVDAKEV